MTGAERIAAERQRQIDIEWHDADHDSEWTEGELSGAGAAYATLASRQIGSGFYEAEAVKPPAQTWRWAHTYWKPSLNPIRNLEKAGALIAAEIDRLLVEDDALSLRLRVKPEEPHEHEWVDAWNEAVLEGEWCPGCGAIRGGNP